MASTQKRWSILITLVNNTKVTIIPSDIQFPHPVNGLFIAPYTSRNVFAVTMRNDFKFWRSNNRTDSFHDCIKFTTTPLPKNDRFSFKVRLARLAYSHSILKKSSPPKGGRGKSPANNRGIYLTF